MLSEDARLQLEPLQTEKIEFGEGDRAFDDIINDLLATPLMVEMRKIDRALKRGTLEPDVQERAVRRKMEIKDTFKKLEKIGFKTTRYRAISKVRADQPLPERGE